MGETGVGATGVGFLGAGVGVIGPLAPETAPVDKWGSALSFIRQFPDPLLVLKGFLCQVHAVGQYQLVTNTLGNKESPKHFESVAQVLQQAVGSAALLTP